MDDGKYFLLKRSCGWQHFFLGLGRSVAFWRRERIKDQKEEFSLVLGVKITRGKRKTGEVLFSSAGRSMHNTAFLRTK